MRCGQGANIFVNADGRWFLGDFGSATPHDMPVLSYTRCFHKHDLMGEPAAEQYDWYMLAVALAVEVCKESWREKLLDAQTQRPVDRALVSVAAAVDEPELQKLLISIMKDGNVESVV